MQTAVGVLTPLLLLATNALAVEQTAAWISVDQSGTPKTLTPVLSTANGLPTIVSNAAPHEITATVFTTTEHGYVTVSTGVPDVYEATPGGSNGAGAFPVCQLAVDDAGTAPFCYPRNSSVLNPGITYYITWDPKFLKNATTNTTIAITASYANVSSPDPVNITLTPSGGGDDADDKPLPLSRGFFAWPVPWDVLQGGTHAVDVALALHATTTRLNRTETTTLPGPVVAVEKRRAFQPRPPPAVAGPEVYVAIPVVLTFVLLMVFGTFWWNRGARRIDLPALSRSARRSRARGRYQRIGDVDEDDDGGDHDGHDHAPSARRNKPRGHGNESIRLAHRGPEDHVAARRRYSVESLGSLAGSPDGYPRKRHGD